MDAREILYLSFDALKERRVKSVLTILMVMVGSALMVAVGGVGAGFGAFFAKQTSNLAPNIMFISSAQTPQNANTPGASSGGPPPAPKITLNAAVQSRLKSLPFVDDAIPSYQGQVTLKSQGKIKEYGIFAIDPKKLFVLAPTLELVPGSTLRSNDPSSITVSNDVANPPGESTPFLSLGQTVRVTYSFVDPTNGKQETESKSFVVGALIKPTGNPTIDKGVVVTLQTGNALLHKEEKFDSLILVAKSASFVDVVEQEIRKLYGNDIGITTVKAIIKTVQEFTRGVTSFLNSIAIISLIVGAVGIITTLYTSVVERTKEIGMMKAVGANNRDILILFLAEALMIGTFGAASGLMAGILGGNILSAGLGRGQAAIAPVFLPFNMITVWLITTGLSVMAGLFPAIKASRLQPIVALRRE
jgi:putative ABC transport system permease protein